jgi:hypothetical protein
MPLSREEIDPSFSIRGHKEPQQAESTTMAPKTSLEGERLRPLKQLAMNLRLPK